MSAIDKLRAAFDLTQAALDLERKGTATATYGDHIDAMSGPLASVAVIELADRLDKLEALCTEPAATGSPLMPFRVSGPGKYRQRNGERVDIFPSGGSAWPWQDRDGRNWDAAGVRFFQSKQAEYLIEGPLADEREMVPMRGMVKFEVGKEPKLMGAYFLDCAELTIDLSHVPANAIVRPELTRETRRVWLIARKCGTTEIWDQRPQPHQFSRDNWDGIAAIVECDIEFTPGEGLDRQ